MTPTANAAPAASSRSRAIRVGRWLRFRVGGVRPDDLVEVDKLGIHIVSRLRDASAESEASQHQDVLDDWVTARFTNPLSALLRQSNRNVRGNVLLNLVVVGGGFATSGIAVLATGTSNSDGSSPSAAVQQQFGSSWMPWVVFVIGLLVALAGGISQLFRPGYRGTQRLILAMQMREEGWAFAMRTGDYPIDDSEAFERFNTRVCSIHRRATEIVGLEPEPATSDPASSKPPDDIVHPS